MFKIGCFYLGLCSRPPARCFGFTRALPTYYYILEFGSIDHYCLGACHEIYEGILEKDSKGYPKCFIFVLTSFILWNGYNCAHIRFDV